MTLQRKFQHSAVQTPSVTQFFKQSYKISHPLGYRCPGMLCLALPARRKVPKLEFQSEFSM